MNYAEINDAICLWALKYTQFVPDTAQEIKDEFIRMGEDYDEGEFLDDEWWLIALKIIRTPEYFEQVNWTWVYREVARIIGDE